MASLEKVVSFLNDYLKVDGFLDSSYNGLQFEGNKDVRKIIFAVDAGVETFQRAAELKADLIIVHHGLFWKGADPSVNGAIKKRLEILYENNISLYAAHLPLDRNKIVGNNSELIRLIGAKISGDFALSDGNYVGWTGEFPKPITISVIEAKLNNTLNTKSIILPFGKKQIRTIAVCSGGGGYARFWEALDRSVDAYLTGEPVEIYHAAKDNGINVIFSGHHATETVGLIALSKVVKKKLNVDTLFMDIPTGL